jgi:hypothetical protein
VARQIQVKIWVPCHCGREIQLESVPDLQPICEECEADSVKLAEFKERRRLAREWEASWRRATRG